MGTIRKVRKAASRMEGRLVVDASVATDALAAPTPVVSRPTGNLVEVAAESAVRFIFGATTTDGHNFTYQVVGWYKVEMPAGVADTWFGVLLAKGTVTAGTLAITGITNGLFADTITDSATTLVNTTYITIANHVAMLTVDTQNAAILEVETNVGTATAAYVWAIPGEFAR